MDVQVLYRFPITAPKRELPRAWLFQEGSDGILVVAYISNKVQLSPFSCSLSFLLLDLKSKTILKEVTTSYPLTDIEALHLAYDPTTMTWVIADLEFQDATGSYHIVVRILHDESGQPVLTDPIFDEPARDMAPIGPILALHASNNSCRLMYRKSDIDCSSTPEKICLERIDIATQQAEQSIEGYAESALLYQI